MERGLSRWWGENESVPKSLGFRGDRLGHGRTRERKERKKGKREKRPVRGCWAGSGLARAGVGPAPGMVRRLRTFFIFLAEQFLPFLLSVF